MDPITLTVESLGLIILLIWLVLPIREFRGIYLRLKNRPHTPPTPDPSEK